MSGRETHLAPFRCPHCGATHEATTGLNADTPGPGSVSLCIRCGRLSFFTDSLQLRAPTAAELAELKASDTWPLIRKARRALAEALARAGRAGEAFRVALGEED